MTENTINNDMTMRGGDASTLAVIDQYEVIRKLGGGGFGSVYLAKDSVSGIEVAIKGLPPVVKNSTEELERIRENFALVARLHHPNIAAALHLHLVRNAEYRQVGVYEDLRVEPSDTLMVMEYAPGVTLSQWRKQFPDGRVPLPDAVAIVWQVAQALDYAHASHIIHRDIKPSNIMVETVENGESIVRVLDFGLAAEIRSSMGRVSMEVRSTSGTRPYMAPEQWAGQKQGSATDQYSLAVLFCELVTGEVPFASVFETGDPMIMMTTVCNRPVELPAGCPRRHALERALGKESSKRFPSCMDFIENLAKSEARYDAESGLTSDGQSSFQQLVATEVDGTSVKSQTWPVRAILVGGMAFAAVVAIATTVFLLSRPASAPVKATSQDMHLAAETTRMETAPLQQKEKRAEAQVDVCPKDSFLERIPSAIAAVTVTRGSSVLSGTQKEPSVRLGPDKVYRVANRYIVPENAELLIEEGTSLAFGAGAGLIVQGKLVVCGSENKRVLFAGESTGRDLWDGIKLFGYKGSVISCAKFSGAKVAVELSKAGVSIANVEFVGNGKALHTSGHYGKGSTLENCLIANNTEGVTFHFAALDFRNCSILDNEKGGVIGSYYGDIKLVDCEVSGNGKGIVDGGYDGSAAAHGCAIFNNREFDVDCRSSKAGDFTGNWWGEKTTEILRREGDGVKLPNIKGNFVNIADFLKERPRCCGVRRQQHGHDGTSLRRIDEGPHTALPAIIESIFNGLVRIEGRKFYISATELSQAQWEAVMGSNPSRHRDPDNPVEMVSFDDAEEFVKRLNAFPGVPERGFVFRLPHDEEWRYAASGGGKGQVGDLGMCWVKENSSEQTHRVGIKRPNALGLFDMQGNVWEWTDRASNGKGTRKGGSYCDDLGACSLGRWIHTPSHRRYDSCGFRLAADKTKNR